MGKTKELQPSDIVVFGATGDLCMRKIIPALYYRLREGQLPADSRIWMLSRSEMTDGAFKAEAYTAAQKFIAAADLNDADWKALTGRMQYQALDAKTKADFEALKASLDDGPRPVRVFYLSTPASIFGPICHHLRDVDLVTEQSRVVLEKPIGYDLDSFREINDQVLSCFREEQVYRIDHYLGKETVQNLLVLRFANNVFARMWNGAEIDHVQITVAESTGLENRHAYYDDSGALRDMVQNHLLQLLCLVAMEPPNHVTPDAVRDEKLKVLRALRPVTADMTSDYVVKGQFTDGHLQGDKVPSYRDEIGDKQTETETYVALKAMVDNWRWADVPFYLRTGKRMEARYSEIVIYFRSVPHDIFPGQGDSECNKLIIRLQPDESLTFQMITKVPGPGGYRLKPVNLNLSLLDEFEERFPDAYERLLMDVVRGNPTLFMRSDEVEAAWCWVETLMEHWDRVPLRMYDAGSEGPKEADALLHRDGRAWHDSDA